MEAKAEKYFKKPLWTPDEDEKLLDYMNSRGGRPEAWRLVPEKARLPSKSWRSCRLRWMTYLKPDLIKGPLSVEEKEHVLALQRDPEFTYKRNGLIRYRWSKIAKSLPGRTDNQVKIFFYLMEKKKKKLLQSQNPSPTDHAINKASNETSHDLVGTSTTNPSDPSFLLSLMSNWIDIIKKQVDVSTTKILSQSQVFNSQIDSISTTSTGLLGSTSTPTQNKFENHWDLLNVPCSGNTLDGQPEILLESGSGIKDRIHDSNTMLITSDGQPNSKAIDKMNMDPVIGATNCNASPDLDVLDYYPFNDDLFGLECIEGSFASLH